MVILEPTMACGHSLRYLVPSGEADAPDTCLACENKALRSRLAGPVVALRCDNCGDVVTPDDDYWGPATATMKCVLSNDDEYERGVACMGTLVPLVRGDK